MLLQFELDLFSILGEINITKSNKWNRYVPVVLRLHGGDVGNGVDVLLHLDLAVLLAVVYRDTD